MAADVPYTRGAHRVADGVWAYLQPDGGWGRSNAGLIASGDGAASLLVDTLFDLALTAAHARRPAPGDPGGRADHHRGQHPRQRRPLLRQRPGRRRRDRASAAAAAEMAELPPVAAGRLHGGRPRHGRRRRLPPRHLRLVPLRRDRARGARPAPSPASSNSRVGDRPVRLIEVGPAHTAGDVIVVVPDAGVVFTGDIVFHGGHPIVWAGPVANWIAACDRLLALDGHGHGDPRPRPGHRPRRGRHPQGLLRTPHHPRPGPASTPA